MTRVDYQEKYRFTCVCCGSHRVHFKTSMDRPRGKTYQFGDNKSIKEDRNANYRCEECGEHTKEVYDKKKGHTTKP